MSLYSIENKNIAAAQGVWYQHRYCRICNYSILNLILFKQISRVPKFPNIFLGEVLVLVEGLVSGLCWQGPWPRPIHRAPEGLIAHSPGGCPVASWVAHSTTSKKISEISISAIQRKNRWNLVPTRGGGGSFLTIADKSRKCALFFVFKKTFLLSCSRWKDRMSKIPEK